MNKKNKQGFTIIEVLMSMTILAILMAAVGLAFDASVKNYHANQGIYKTTNTGRQALLRITNDLRTATGFFDTSDSYVRAIEPLSSDSPHVIITILDPTTNNYDIIQYRFEADEKTLYLDKGSDSYVLCKNVTAMTFNGTDRSIEKTNNAKILKTVTDTRSVRIKMTLTGDLGKVTQTLAAGSVVRRNL